MRGGLGSANIGKMQVINLLTLLFTCAKQFRMFLGKMATYAALPSTFTFQFSLSNQWDISRVEGGPGSAQFHHQRF